MPSDHREFLIGDWLIQPDQHRIRGATKVTRLEPKVMDVLLCLADQPGITVSRERLLEKVWAGTIVTDDVLTRSISELRKAFDDDARNPAFIETIPKIGYRLIAPIKPDLRGDSVPPEIPTLTLTATSISQNETRKNNHTSARSSNVLNWILGTILIVAGALMWYQTNKSHFQPKTYLPLPLTTYPGHEGSPVLSPDGKQVAFSWSGPNDDNVDIYVKLVGTDNPLRVTDAPERDFMPTWSPDGTQIAYMQRNDQGCEIFTIEALGGTPRKLSSCGNNIYGDLTWSPDGEWLAFNDKDDPAAPFQIVLSAVNTQEKRGITSPPAGSWGDHDPAFSPDGKQLSFTRSLSEGMQDIYTIPVSGGNAIRLTNDSRNISGHTWDASGKTVIFSSNRTGRSSLWLIDEDGGSPYWLGVGNDQVYFPHVAGNRLAYIQGSGQTNIWQFSPDDTSGATPLIASTWWDMHPSWSPDGRHIAFTSNRSGSFEIWLADADGNNQRRLTNFDGPFTSTPRWSPDGKSLVFTSRPGGQADVYTLDIDAQNPRRLTLATTDELAPSWSPDGQSIYFSSNRDGKWNVWRQMLDGNQLEQITENGGFGAMTSTDGQYLYFARNHENGLWRQPIGSKEAELILPNLDSRDWGSWFAQEDGIYYVNRSRPNFIAFLNFSTNQTDTLHIPNHSVPRMDAALAISSNGHILFGQTEGNESDLMYVDDFE